MTSTKSSPHHFASSTWTLCTFRDAYGGTGFQDLKSHHTNTMHLQLSVPDISNEHDDHNYDHANDPPRPRG